MNERLLKLLTPHLKKYTLVFRARAGLNSVYLFLLLIIGFKGYSI
jgi:hypothetical protein